MGTQQHKKKFKRWWVRWLPSTYGGLTARFPKGPGDCGDFSLEGFDETEHSEEPETITVMELVSWFQSHLGPGVLIQPVGLQKGV